MHTPKFRSAFLKKTKSQQAAKKAAKAASVADSGPISLMPVTPVTPAVVLAPGEATREAVARGCEAAAEDEGTAGFLVGCAVGAAGAVAMLLALKRLK